MSASTHFRELLQPALHAAQSIAEELSGSAGGLETATDPEIARLAIERWISDSQIMIDLCEALEKDGRLDPAS